MFKVERMLRENWKFRVIKIITWHKLTNNGELKMNPGGTTMNCYEICLLCASGEIYNRLNKCSAVNAIVSDFLGGSKKPQEIYILLEILLPGVRRFAMFERVNNLSSTLKGQDL